MIKGISGSDGYGIGRVVIISEQKLDFIPKADCDPSLEFEKFKKAVDKFCKRTEKLAEKIKLTAGDNEAEIILGQILMIQDPCMIDEIEKLIKSGQCAQSALVSVCDMFSAIFASAGDDLTRQRAADVNDLKKAVLAILLDRENIDLSDLPPDTIIVAKELTPSMTAGINKKNVAGIICETGSKTSHTAILAEALEIPAVMSVTDAVSKLTNGSVVIVDAEIGVVIKTTDKNLIDEYTQKRTAFNEEKKSLSEYIGKKTLTADGVNLEIFGNIGTPENAIDILKSDGEGIGLFRTEFLFMDKVFQPDEEEQFEAYKKAALIMKNKPVIIRTLDIGGDKNIQYLDMPKEENPFLGFRAIRFCLKNKEMYKTQLRAIVKASAYGDIRIMIPLVTSLDELREVRTMVGDIMRELDLAGIPYKKDLKIGVMIETAAAAVIADLLAHEADFFSIGTNDLIQYTMAADRGNGNVEYLYSAFNPAVLRMIRHVISCGNNAGIPVGMCGESASDRLLIPLLISFGLNEFSVGASSILRTRKEISRWTKKSADELTQEVMNLKTKDEIVNLLKNHIK